MDNSVKNLVVKFIGDTSSLSRAFTETQAAAEVTESRLTRSINTMGSIGSKLLPLSLAIDGIGVYAIRAASQFESSMTEIQTQAGATASEVDSMKQPILEMTSKVGESANQLAEALFFAESAGFRQAQALDITRLAAEGAQIGNANLSDTIKSLVGIMNTHIDGAQNATQAMGNLNAIVGAGMMHFQDLNQAIGTGFFAAAASFGVSLDSAGAALADLTRQGMPAVDAATRLRMSMTLLANPTDKAQKILEAAGFTMDDIQTSSDSMTQALKDANITTSQMASDLQKPDGFSVAIQDMKQHLDDAGIHGKDAAAIITSAFGGGRTSGPILEMINDVTGLTNTYDTLKKNAGNFNQDWQARTKDSQFKWEQFHAAINTFSIEIGEVLLPKVTTALGHIGNGLSDVMAWWNRLSPTAKSAIADIALVLGVGAPLLIGIAKVVEAVQVLGGAFLWLMGPIASLAARFALFATTSVAQIGIVQSSFAGMAAFMAIPIVMPAIAVAAALAALGLVIAKALQTRQVVADMKAGVESDISSINQTTDQMYYNAINMSANTSATLQSVYRLQQSNGYTGANKVYYSQGTYTTGFASGGYTGYGQDNDVAGVVHRGEYVVPKNQVDQSTGMPMASKGGGDINVTVQGGVFLGAGGISEVSSLIYRELQRLSRANGFNGSLPNIGIAPTG